MIRHKKPILGTCLYIYVATKEKQCVVNGGELSDRIIDVASSLLKKQFPDYDGGLLTTLNLLQKHSRGLSQSSNAMQVIHVHKRRH